MPITPKNKSRFPASSSSLNSTIKKLNAPSMSTPDLGHLMSHVATVANVRSALQGDGALSAGICYTQAADSDTVTLWRDGHIVGSTTEQDAHQRNIPACG
jgi:hypothetical protein